MAANVAQLQAEGLKPLRTLLRNIPGNRGGETLHPSTGWRWCIRGVRLRDGTRLKLEHIKAGGGQLLSSAAALERFLGAVTNGTTTPITANQMPLPTPTAKRRETERMNEAAKAALA